MMFWEGEAQKGEVVRDEGRLSSKSLEEDDFVTS